MGVRAGPSGARPPRRHRREPGTIALRQAIAATDPLRAGAYGKTLTFTLAAPSP